MVATFDRMLGVYMMATNEQLPPLVKSWNVKIVRLHPNDRHGDMQLARDFYGFLDALLGARKSSLAY
jgi:RNA pol II accessory factor, Cdc73 family, C-terminal